MDVVEDSFLPHMDATLQRWTTSCGAKKKRNRVGICSPRESNLSDLGGGAVSKQLGYLQISDGSWSWPVMRPRKPVGNPNRKVVKQLVASFPLIAKPRLSNQQDLEKALA